MEEDNLSRQAPIVAGSSLRGLRRWFASIFRASASPRVPSLSQSKAASLLIRNINPYHFFAFFFSFQGQSQGSLTGTYQSDFLPPPIYYTGATLDVNLFTTGPASGFNLVFHAGNLLPIYVELITTLSLLSSRILHSTGSRHRAARITRWW